MLNGYVVIGSLCAFAMLVLSLFVYFRNSRAKLNRLFLIFSIASIGWLLSNYIGGTPAAGHGSALIANRMTFFFVCSGVFVLYLFACELVRTSETFFRRLVFWLNWLAIAFSLTPLYVKGVRRTDNTYSIQFGTGSILFFATLVLDAIMLIGVLFWARKRSHDSARNQVNIVMISFGLFLVCAIATNAALPLLLNYYGLTNVGSSAILILIGGMAYAITKHKLFDIRLIVARSLGYAFSLLALGALYGLTVFGIARYIFHLNLSPTAQVFLSASTGVASLTFPSIKRGFDKLTNKLFYRDAYDPQELFDHLNRALVANFELEKLLKNAATIIADSLKSEYCLFGIKETDFRAMRIIGTVKKDFDTIDIAAVRHLTPGLRTIAIVADDLPSDQEKLKSLLLKNGVAVLVRLLPAGSGSLHQEGLGYLLLGQKKSGNPYSPQDLRVLDTIANELIIAVQNALHYEETQNFNITLQQQVSEATHKLRRSNEKLRQLDATKDDFISMASHQLRTPLTSVKGYLSMVLEGDAGKISAQQAQLLTQSFLSAQRMVYLISDLLNLSRLNTGKFVIEATPIDLAEVVQVEVDQLRETAASRGVALRYERPSGLPKLMLDETKIHQVVMNFIDNAIYYTPSGGTITVDLRETPSYVEYTVKDNGIGVPRAEQHHLFTKFYRAGNARKARPDGTGLGLFMAKKVIAAQGGAIIFDSVEGKGSTFGFRFSKADYAVPAGAGKSPAAVPAQTGGK